MPDQDIKVVETLLELLIKCHLPIDGGLVAGFLQQFGEGLLVPVKRLSAINHETVQVIVFAGQDDGPAGAADAELAT